MKVYKSIAKTLHDEGVTDVFGLMGHGNMEILTEMVNAYGTNYYSVRQENAALAAAAGYAHTSRRVGVATTNHGPGVTNAITALTSAVNDRAPVVFFTNDIASKGGGHHCQGIDHAAIAQVTGAGYEHVRYPEYAAYQTSKAFRRAKAERRPILLNILPEIFHEEGPPAPKRYGDRLEEPRLAPDPQSIRAAADLIEKAEYPVILAGFGAHLSGARAVLDALGERLGAVMLNALRGKGFFSGNPYDLGTSGGFSSDLARRYAAKADCVISFGSGMKRLTMTIYPPTAALIHFDIDQEVFDTYRPSTHWVQGDAKVSAELLLEELERRGVEKTGFRTPELAAEIAGYSRATEFVDESTDDQLDPRTTMLEIDPHLPRERTIITDCGIFHGWPSKYMTVPDPGGFLFTDGFGAVGLGLGYSIGAYVGRRERRPVLVIGDGGLMMSVQEFETAVRHRIPLIVLVMNDEAYGAEATVLKRDGHPPNLAYFDNPTFEEIARAMGGEGYTVRRREEIEPAVRRALEVEDKPVLIDLHIKRGVVPRWLEGLSFLESIYP